MFSAAKKPDEVSWSWSLTAQRTKTKPRSIFFISVIQRTTFTKKRATYKKNKNEKLPKKNPTKTKTKKSPNQKTQRQLFSCCITLNPEKLLVVPSAFQLPSDEVGHLLIESTKTSDLPLKQECVQFSHLLGPSWTSAWPSLHLEPVCKDQYSFCCLHSVSRHFLFYLVHTVKSSGRY